MKIKHNKKRNTAFVYEALIREATVAIIKNDIKKKDKIVGILHKHFGPNTPLRRHLDCYRALYENQDLSEKDCEKILQEAKMASRLLDTQGLFVSQSELIDDVNKELTPSLYDNFVPNYKTLASIYQIFSQKLPPRSAVILENQIVQNMTKKATLQETLEPIDNLVFGSFVEKFNDKYSAFLEESQKQLLGLYIASFQDNSLELKIYLNEEIARLKEAISGALSLTEFDEDPVMLGKAEKIIEKLETFGRAPVSDSVITTILKTQELVKELNTDASND